MKLTHDSQTTKAVAQLVGYAFNKQQALDQDEIFLSRYKHADLYGETNEQEVTSFILVDRFKVQLFEKVVSSAGIGYVASYPEHRGNGAIKRLMQEILQDLFAKQVALSQLAPFSESFYRQFGYAVTSLQKCYRIKEQAFLGFKNEQKGTIKRGDWQTLAPLIKALYAKQLKNKQVGTLVRSSWWWERLDKYYGGRFYAVIFDQAGQACGYLSYRVKGPQLYVDELVYENAFALRKSLTYLKAHLASFQEIIYNAPLHEQLERYFPEQRLLEITQKPYMMSRIIDVKQVLPLFFPKEVVVEVTNDDFCPQNVGRWEVKGGTCQPSKKRPDLAGSITALSELLCSDLTLDQASLLEKLKLEPHTKDLQLRKGQQSFYDYF